MSRSPVPPARSAMHSPSASPRAQLLGPDQRVQPAPARDHPGAAGALQGVVMELDDCAFPTLEQVVATDDANVAFRDCQVAMLVGARPRGPGMERKDLLLANAQIFSAQGKALNDARRPQRARAGGRQSRQHQRADRPRNARDLNPRNFTAMTRLDHNRALAQLADKTGAHVTDIRRMTIWGNHSATQYPDLSHALVNGRARPALVEQQVDRGDLHSDGAAARRRGHQGARRVLGRLGRLGRDRSRAHLGARARRRTTGSAWRCPPTAATASPRASSIPTR